MPHSPHFISSRRHFIISRHGKKGEDGAVRYCGRETTFAKLSVQHIVKIFISYSLLVLVVNLSLYLIYELNSMTGMCIEKNTIQSTLEQRSFELCGSTYTRFFFSVNTIGPLYPQVSRAWIRPTADQKQYFHTSSCRFPTMDQKCWF